MHRHCGAILSVLLASVAAYGAEPSSPPAAGASVACEDREPEVRPAAPNALPVEETKVEVVSTAPETDIEVSRERAVQLHVRYQIEDFTPDTFHLNVLAAGVDSQRRLGNSAPSASARLENPSGEVVLCLPFAQWWDDESIMWPLEVSVTLHRQYGIGSSTVVAASEKLTYSSPTAPQRQQIDNTAAMKAESVVHGMYYQFERANQMRDFCVENQRANASETATIYDAWDRKHSALRDEVNDALFAIYLARVKGYVPAALQFVDHLKRQIAEDLQFSGEPSHAEALCQRYAAVLDQISGRLSKPEDLAIMRAYRPAE